MVFFLMILAGTAAATVLGMLRVPTMGSWRARMRWGLAGALAFAGVHHLMTPDRYTRMIEPFLPFPEAIVLVTGLLEIAGAIGLLIPRTRHLAAVLLAVYFVAVLPANVSNIVNGIRFESLPTGEWYYWLRLAFQVPIIAWTLYVGGIWPRREAAGVTRA